MNVRLRDYRFFRDHAGYVVGQRAEGAIQLARAEAIAKEIDAEFRWEDNPDGELGDHEFWCPTARATERGRHQPGWFTRNGSQCNHEIESCTMFVAGEPVASLGGIIDASDTYRRVVEAELALGHVADSIPLYYAVAS